MKSLVFSLGIVSVLFLQGCGVIGMPLASSHLPSAAGNHLTQGQEGHGGDVMAAEWAQLAHKLLVHVEWETLFRKDQILMSQSEVRAWQHRLEKFPVHSGETSANKFVELIFERYTPIIMVNREKMKGAGAEDVFESLKIFNPDAQVDMPVTWALNNMALSPDPLQEVRFNEVSETVFRTRARQAIKRVEECSPMKMQPPRRTEVDLATLRAMEVFVNNVRIRPTKEKLVDKTTGLEVDAISRKHSDDKMELLFSETRITPEMVNTVGFMSFAFHEFRNMVSTPSKNSDEQGDFFGDERYRYSRGISNVRCY